jgi:hypothetical protein
MPEVFKRLRLLKSKTSILTCARPAMSAHQMQGKMIVLSLLAGVRWTRLYFRYPQVRRLGDRRLGIGAHIVSSYWRVTIDNARSPVPIRSRMIV